MNHTAGTPVRAGCFSAMVDESEFFQVANCRGYRKRFVHTVRCARDFPRARTVKDFFDSIVIEVDDAGRLSRGIQVCNRPVVQPIGKTDCNCHYFTGWTEYFDGYAAFIAQIAAGIRRGIGAK